MKQKHPKFWSTPTGWAAMALIAAVTYFLLVEHAEHVFEYLPFAILLLCPLMHLFMHGSHGKHHHDEHHDADETDTQSVHDSFHRKSEQGESYREGFIAGLHQAREEQKHKGDNDAQ